MLTTPIEDLELTQTLKSMLAANNIKTFNDVLELPVQGIMMLHGFTMHNLNEMVSFLESKNLAHLITHEI